MSYQLTRLILQDQNVIKAAHTHLLQPLDVVVAKGPLSIPPRFLTSSGGALVDIPPSDGRGTTILIDQTTQASPQERHGMENICRDMATLLKRSQTIAHKRYISRCP